MCAKLKAAVVSRKVVGQDSSPTVNGASIRSPYYGGIKFFNILLIFLSFDTALYDFDHFDNWPLLLDALGKFNFEKLRKIKFLSA